MVSCAEREVALWVAVIVTVVMKPPLVVRMVKFALAAPAGTVTVLGTLARAELLRNCTVSPPEGAGAVSVIVPVAL